MPKQYDIYGPSQEVLIPLVDGTFTTGSIPPNEFSNATCWVAFYDSSGNILSPTTGTIDFESMGIYGQWLKNGTINAVDVVGPTALYTPVTFSNGPVREVKVTLSGVDVATHFSAFVWRY